jgi:hypothetical protein
MLPATRRRAAMRRDWVRIEDSRKSSDGGGGRPDGYGCGCGRPASTTRQERRCCFSFFVQRSDKRLYGAHFYRNLVASLEKNTTDFLTVVMK